LKPISARSWLSVILAITLALVVWTQLTAGFSEAALVLAALVLLLFALTFKGFRWARYLLAILYTLGGVAAFASVTAASLPGARLMLEAFGVFSVLSAIYLFSSKPLRVSSQRLEGGG
jgi:hypothetical protein